MHLLIDADIVVFRFASAFSKKETTDWGGGLVTESKINLPKAKQELDKFVDSLKLKTWADKITMCFTDKVNFRYSVLPTYKYNRAGQDKPELYNTLQSYVRKNYDCKSKPGLEADDVMGIMSTLDPGNCCIATIDKDLLQIPGLHYNWNWGRSFECFVEDCDRYFYQQILTGDPGDGYKGIPGIGVVTAQKLLESFDHDNIWSEIVKAYESHGLTEADALQQAGVARMCRAEDYNFDKQEVILWEPY